MGKFAEFCKGKTMGAFFLLLLHRSKLLGYDAFMTGRHCRSVERDAGAEYCG